MHQPFESLTTASTSQLRTTTVRPQVPDVNLSVDELSEHASMLLNELQAARRDSQAQQLDPAQLALSERELEALKRAREEAAQLASATHSARATKLAELQSLQNTQETIRKRIREYQELFPGVPAAELAAAKPAEPTSTRFTRALKNRLIDDKKIIVERRTLESDLKNYFATQPTLKRARLTRVIQENEQLRAAIATPIVFDANLQDDVTVPAIDAAAAQQLK